MSEDGSKTDSHAEGDNLGDVYFEIQGELDFTKHPGALDATDAISELCRIGPGYVVVVADKATEGVN